MADAALMPHLSALERAVAAEGGFRGAAQPPHSAGGVITCGMRDGSAHVLRCLKVWYDLPNDVFFGAVSCIDRFLAKMKAQPKHLSCIAVSAFHLSCLQHMSDSSAVPDPADLVNISQSRCSPSDLLRMQAILAAKLDLHQSASQQQVVTSLTMLRLLWAAARAAAARLGLEQVLEAAPPPALVQQLEILTCDSLTLAHRPSEVALALLAAEFQRRGSGGGGRALMGVASELQRLVCANSPSFVSCVSLVVNLLEKYNGAGSVAHRQRLVWKLSNRTLRTLRPTDKLRPTLPTIKEGAANAAAAAHRLRSNSECSEESMESLSSESDDFDLDAEESE